MVLGFSKASSANTIDAEVCKSLFDTKHVGLISLSFREPEKIVPGWTTRTTFEPINGLLSVIRSIEPLTTQDIQKRAFYYLIPFNQDYTDYVTPKGFERVDARLLSIDVDNYIVPSTLNHEEDVLYGFSQPFYAYENLPTNLSFAFLYEGVSCECLMVDGTMDEQSMSRSFNYTDSELLCNSQIFTSKEGIE